MAQKATVCKAAVQLADVDRAVYGDHLVTLARHPSETDERMMIRLLAFVLNVPGDSDAGHLREWRPLAATCATSTDLSGSWRARTSRDRQLQGC